MEDEASAKSRFTMDPRYLITKTLSFKSNTICRTCLSPLLSKDEVFSETCVECPRFPMQSMFKRSHSILSYQDRDSIFNSPLSDSDSNELINKIQKSLSLYKKAIQDNKEKLNSALDSVIPEKIKALVQLKNNVSCEMLTLRQRAEKMLHKIVVPNTVPEGILINKLLNNEQFAINGPFKYKIKPNAVVTLIRQANVSIRPKLEELKNEPELIYFLPKSAPSTMKKFKIFSKDFTENPLKSDKEIKWPEKGSFVEFRENMFLYAGEISLFSRDGVWLVDLNQNATFASLIGQFPGRENHTLEYLEPFLYVIGGNSKKIQSFALNYNNNGWKDLISLPEELGYSHSMRIGNAFYIVGSRSVNLYKYFAVDNKFVLEKNKWFVAGDNKLIFEVNKDRIVVVKDRVLLNDEEKCGIGQDFSKLRCLGKGKVVYSYLYFLTVSEKGLEQVWRLCLKLFRLDNFERVVI